MKSTILKGYLSILLLAVVFAPGVYYVAYTFTDSILVSLLSLVVAYFLWRFIFGGGLKKRRKYVDKIMENDFPSSEEDPFLDAIGSFTDKAWINGNGYTDEVDQPMYVKATENGIAILFVCRGEKKPIMIAWDKITHITFMRQSAKTNRGMLAKLLIMGVGIKLLIPWVENFSKHIPERIGVTRHVRMERHS